MAEQVPETVEAVAENPMKLLGAAIAAAAPQGAVTGFDLARGGAELAVRANRDQLLLLMLLLRDDPRFPSNNAWIFAAWIGRNALSVLKLSIIC